MGVGHLDHRGKGHRFAGDIRRACNGDQRNRAFFERGLEPVQGFFQCPAGDNAVIIVTLPGEQVGMMLDVQIDDLAFLWPASLWPASLWPASLWPASLWPASLWPAAVWHRLCQQVQRISGITGKNHDIISSRAQEPVQRRSR